MSRTYEEMTKKLEVLQQEDEQVFKQVKEAKEHMCNQYNKQCMLVANKGMDCYTCEYYVNNIKPLEDRSLELLVELTKLQKEIDQYIDVK